MDAVMAAAKEYAVTVGKVEDGTFSNCNDERDFLEAAIRSYAEEAVKQERERYDELFAKYNEVCVEVARLKFALPPLDDAIRARALQQGD